MPEVCELTDEEKASIRRFTAQRTAAQKVRRGNQPVVANAASGTAAMSQQDVADLLGMTRTRVFQLEQRAMLKIKAAIQAEARAAGVTIQEWLFEAI